MNPKLFVRYGTENGKPTGCLRWSVETTEWGLRNHEEGAASFERIAELIATATLLHLPGDVQSYCEGTQRRVDAMMAEPAETETEAA